MTKNVPKNLLSKACRYSLIALVASSFHSQAEELPEFTEEDLFIDIPQVVSATRQVQSLTKAPASITILTRKEIDASGAVRIADIFRLVPGMHAYQVLTNTSAVSYHGMANDHPTRLEVMINGHSIYLPLLSTVAWETIGITLDDIDYVEVVRGSNAPAYGSNAFTGAINIITKTAFTDPKPNIKVSHGSLDSEQYSFAFGDVSELLQYRVSGAFEKNDGSDNYNDGMLNRNLTFSGTFTPSLNTSIDFNLGLSTGSIDIGQADDLENGFSPRDHESHYQHIRWNHTNDDGDDYKISFTHNYLDLNEVFLPALDAFLHLQNLELEDLSPADIATVNFIFGDSVQPLGTEHGVTELFDLEFQHSLNLNENTSAVWGVGYRAEYAESETLLQDRGKVSEDKWRFFGNIQWDATDNLSINTGATYENTSISSSFWSPRIAANYALNDTSDIRASVTRAYRTPSLLDKNGQFGFKAEGWDAYEYYDLTLLPNYSIEPEKLTSYELGYFNQWSSTGSYIDLRVFTEHFSNALDSYRTQSDEDIDIDDDAFRITDNVAYWRNTGAEVQLKVAPSSSLFFLANYSYINVQGERNRGNRKTLEDEYDSLGGCSNNKCGVEAARTPLHTASLLVNWQPTPNTSISATHYYMDDVRWLEGGDRHQYHRTDLILSQDFKFSALSNLNTRLIVQNLFDDEYSEFYEFNIMDRRVYLQVSMDF